jgi:predicted AAA+ superfamily ATPase
MEKITPFMGKPAVKVITGMRRSGKCCLIRRLMGKLVADGVRREQIVYVDKESFLS